MSRRSIWFGTVGLAQQFGGIAHVARCSVETLTSARSQLRLDRVVSLLDSADSAVVTAPSDPPIQGCDGSRVRFTAGVLAQTLARPSAVLFDHVDIAQCQTLLPRRFRAPYAVWVNGIEVWKELPKRKLAALRGAELLIFISDFTRRRFESFHGDGFPSRVVHLTAGDTDQPVPPSGRPREPWILTVGRLEPDRPKGHEQILDAMPGLSCAVSDLQWHVVGKGDALEPFRRRVAESPCAGQIQVHGFLPGDELQELYSRCRVFAMPSFGEGFGIVYLEAMQRGCVPVGSTLDAASEVIGEGGICVGLDNPADLERCLEELLTEPRELYERRSQRARERAGRFSQARFQEDLLGALDQMVGTS